MLQGVCESTNHNHFNLSAVAAAAFKTPYPFAHPIELLLSQAQRLLDEPNVVLSTTSALSGH